ncbi:MAG TPA: Maf family protein [Terriglobales bacterium]|nr:Maf family protein [Terriglobales bacterium]
MKTLGLVLASSSPRRKKLLSLTGLPFEVRPADINEDVHEKEEPQPYVIRLAEEKAAAVAHQIAGEDVLVLAADTTVAQDGVILGKPADAIEAKKILTELRGRSHVALTGITIMRSSDGATLTDLAETQVPMRNYSNEEIDAYVATGDPLDKAGSYAIQNAQFHPVENMQGCFANVAGLPLLPFAT